MAFPKNITSQLITWQWVLPIVIFSFLVVDLSSDIPIGDDYSQQFNTINIWEEGRDLGSVLFRQHNEHRLFTTYIVPFMEYILLGNIDLRRSIFLSIPLLIAIWFLLITLMGKETTTAGRKGLIAMFVFVPLAVSSVWAGGSIQYYCLVLFGFLSIYFLTKRGSVFILLSILCCFLSIYSMASGVLLIIPAMVYMILEGKLKLKSSLLWLTFYTVFTYLYFDGFVSPGHHPSVLAAMTNPLFLGQYYLTFTLNFMRNVLGTDYTWIAALMIHLGLVIFVYQHRKLVSLRDPLVLCFLFMMLVILSISAGRSGFNDLMQANSSRYVLFSKFYWLFLYIWLVNNRLLNHSLERLAYGLVLFVFCLQTMLETQRTMKYRTNLEAGFITSYVEQDHSGLIHPNGNLVRQLIDEYIIRGVYRPEILGGKIPQHLDKIEKSELTNDSRLSVKAESLSRDGSVTEATGTLNRVDLDSEFMKVEMAFEPLKSPGDIFLFPCNSINIDEDENQIARSRNFRDIKFGCEILTSDILKLVPFKTYLVVKTAQGQFLMDYPFRKEI